MLGHEFMRNAFLAGTPIALACGLAGYFVVLRGQVFAGDALSHVAFAGALAAAALGLDTRVGLFAATAAVAVGLSALGGRARSDDVVIGSVFAWVLGLGALFLSIFASGQSGASGTTGVRILFGSILGLDRGQAWVAAAVAAGVCCVLLAVGRPVLFASVDPQVAAAQGVRVRALGAVFLVLVAVTTAESTQAVGALLLLGLLAAPAGTALALTASPYTGMALSAIVSVACTWGGLTLSYQVPSLPPSTAIVSLACACYAAAAASRALAVGRRQSADAGEAAMSHGYHR
jgi:zinc/manganese transport system permease protein